MQEGKTVQIKKQTEAKGTKHIINIITHNKHIKKHPD